MKFILTDGMPNRQYVYIGRGLRFNVSGNCHLSFHLEISHYRRVLHVNNSLNGSHMFWY